MNRREREFCEQNLNEVLHMTINPYGPGVVRIHLVPAKLDFKRRNDSVAIINGKDIVPLTLSWTILLATFIKEVNKYEGNEITDEDLKVVSKNTQDTLKKIYPFTRREIFERDIKNILATFFDIAAGKVPNAEIAPISISDYADKMRAPHRMDLMISSMVKDGAWNCNQKCLHCYAAGQEYSEKKELTTEEWKKVIDVCRKNCISQLTFTGGEPTRRDDLPELIKYASWFVTRLNTNGVLLTKELCQKLVDASLDSVQVTFYSSNPDEHNLLVGAKNFDKTVEGIKNALEAKIPLNINTPLCTLNKDYVETLKFLKGLGVKYVSCSGLIVTGNATKEESKKTQLSSDELYEMLKAAKEYCDANEMEMLFTSPGWVEADKLREIGLDVPGCGACLSNMAVAPDGELIPCQSWLCHDAGLGNMLTDDWEKMWDSEKCVKIRTCSAQSLGFCPLRKREE